MYSEIKEYKKFNNLQMFTSTLRIFDVLKILLTNLFVWCCNINSFYF